MVKAPSFLSGFTPYNPERPGLQTGDEGNFKSKDEEKPCPLRRGYTGFTKKERINHPQDFRRVMKLGKRLQSKSIILFIQENKTGFHRLGMVVKKEIGPATYRNRMKRFFREFFRLHKHQISGSLDMVILVKKGSVLSRYGEAEEELRGLLIR